MTTSTAACLQKYFWNLVNSEVTQHTRVPCSEILLAVVGFEKFSGERLSREDSKFEQQLESKVGYNEQTGVSEFY